MADFDYLQFGPDSSVNPVASFSTNTDPEALCDLIVNWLRDEYTDWPGQLSANWCNYHRHHPWAKVHAKVSGRVLIELYAQVTAQQFDPATTAHSTHPTFNLVWKLGHIWVTTVRRADKRLIEMYATGAVPEGLDALAERLRKAIAIPDAPPVPTPIDDRRAGKDESDGEGQPTTESQADKGATPKSTLKAIERAREDMQMDSSATFLVRIPVVNLYHLLVDKWLHPLAERYESQYGASLRTNGNDDLPGLWMISLRDYSALALRDRIPEGSPLRGPLAIVWATLRPIGDRTEGVLEWTDEYVDRARVDELLAKISLYSDEFVLLDAPIGMGDPSTHLTAVGTSSSTDAKQAELAARNRQRNSDARAQYSTNEELEKGIRAALAILDEMEAELTLQAVRDTRMGYSPNGWKKMLKRLGVDDAWVWAIIHRFSEEKELEKVQLLKTQSGGITAEMGRKPR